ncbi:RHS repeat domain-containing protein [Parvicella tangerina]|uniref:RHS repeat-associated core domain-containing protein n=1 Tax=Parvicella tangerina TaxID=2829795 RepID=A0A916JNI6_9FLAO|nr:RHS repeat-associated core domain-containing protein [Parvicella tangerina]CAG5084057.1 hypothetical protein CRYO30217_02363 [Parvicella tangerina]
MINEALKYRCISDDVYRYGFNGMERDDEEKGAGNSINYKYRMHDPRLGRFFAVDPLVSEYPWNSPYAFSENSVVAFVELEGLERYYAANGSLIGQYGDNPQVRIIRSDGVEKKARAYFNGDARKEIFMKRDVLDRSVRFSLGNLAEKQNVATEIFEEMGYSRFLMENNKIDIITEGGSCYCFGPSKPMQIEIGGGSSNYFTIVNILTKEVTHMSDYHLGTNNNYIRELNGVIRAMEDESFAKSDIGHQEKMLRDAAGWMFYLKNDQLYEKKFEEELGKGPQTIKYEEHVERVKAIGVDFDWSGQLSKMKEMGGNHIAGQGTLKNIKLNENYEGDYNKE